MTYEEAEKLPDATNPIAGIESKVLMHSEIGDYFWIWIESKTHHGKYDFALSDRKQGFNDKA